MLLPHTAKSDQTPSTNATHISAPAATEPTTTSSQPRAQPHATASEVAEAGGDDDRAITKMRQEGENLRVMPRSSQQAEIRDAPAPEARDAPAVETNGELEKQPVQSPTLPGQPAHAQQLPPPQTVAQQGPPGEEAQAHAQPDEEAAWRRERTHAPSRWGVGPIRSADEERRKELGQLIGCQILRDEHVLGLVIDRSLHES